MRRLAGVDGPGRRIAALCQNPSQKYRFCNLVELGGIVARKSQPVELPPQARLIVPVLGSVGGCGRSTVAGLLGCGFAAMGRSVVLDTGPRLSSPWPGWAEAPGGGLLDVPPDRPLTAAQLEAAASASAAPAGHRWQILTDHQEWSRPPLPLPTDPWAWYQLAAVGGWQVTMADTVVPVADEILRSRCAGRTSMTATWCSLPYAVPVLSTAATGSGVRALQASLMAASAEGLPLARTVVSVVCTAPGPLPSAVKAAVTMLEPRVSAVVTVPHDPHLRAQGLCESRRLKARTQRSGALLAQAVLSAAHAAWGNPLPAPPAPAPLPAQAVAAPVSSPSEEVSS